MPDSDIEQDCIGLETAEQPKIFTYPDSVSIEGAFWKALKEIAVAQNISANALISKIDNEREAANLSSAIRVYVVEHYRLAANASADP